MNINKFRGYAISVIAYYRAEWTDISDDDERFRLFVTTDLQDLIKGCWRRGTPVPNAAKEVDIFLELESARPAKEARGECDEDA